MPTLAKLAIAAASGIASFALLLLIISVATPVWLDGGQGHTIGLFRKCYGENLTGIDAPNGPGCTNENRAPQAGLSVFGLLLLAFSIIAAIAGMFMDSQIGLLILYGSLGLLYFASMFIMSAYATWGVHSRDEEPYFFPRQLSNVPHTNMGYSYNLCVAAHYFLWTALTMLAYGIGYRDAQARTTTTQ
ncbi:unnamed protein product [Rotaria sordida]|uniref:Uncharacterized protein n=1 Tax=Rotaria sordida TaxID=392033 RepID=A0A814CXU1_9BILA|nr:unnamed protein product [Rotaria sordida]CAF0843776.1 unnamed protein product [Rotaria sordida]CAF0889174.1 unnamed protein product [Rotaria sordida]CAF0890265.1 unnamed protein product [Rotaria sordida]CAF0949521.1 unnamed protein product [Rotaria sordida]